MRQRGITLIELLIAMTIMTVVTTMVLMGWFALQQSYSYSASSNVQRDNARQALSRMQREIRDAQTPTAGSAASAAISYAGPFSIVFYTTFNIAGNTSASLAPRMVMYRLYSDGTVWRFSDVNGGGIAYVNTSPTTDYPSDSVWPWSVSEQQYGEGAQLVVNHVTNYSSSPGNPVPLFQYTYYDGGNLVTAPSATNYNDDLGNTIAVTVRMLVDLVPGHTPVSADLQTTAQLRNQRN